MRVIDTGPDSYCRGSVARHSVPHPNCIPTHPPANACQQISLSALCASPLPSSILFFSSSAIIPPIHPAPSSVATPPHLTLNVSAFRAVLHQISSPEIHTWNTRKESPCSWSWHLRLLSPNFSLPMHWLSAPRLALSPPQS